jgi:DNA polymerase-3 subunit beta
MADDKINALRFDIKDGEIKLSVSSTETGEGEETIETDYNGSDVSINLNAQFIADFLRVTSTPKVYINFVDEKSPVKLNFGDDNYKYMALPLRISKTS